MSQNNIAFAFKTNNYSYLISQTTIGGGLVKLKESKDEVLIFRSEDDKKNNKRDNKKITLVTFTGPQASSFRLGNILQSQLSYISKSLELEINSNLIKNLIKNFSYSKLRTRNPLSVHSLIVNSNDRVDGIKVNGSKVGGDNSVGGMPKVINNKDLVSIDGYGAIHTDQFISTGYGGYFLLGLYDQINQIKKDSMTDEEAIIFINKCINTLKEKLILETNCWRMDRINGNEIKTDFIEI